MFKAENHKHLFDVGFCDLRSQFCLKSDFCLIDREVFDPLFAALCSNGSLSAMSQLQDVFDDD